MKAKKAVEKPPKRYVVAVAKKEDPACYKHVVEMDGFSEAKNKCIDLSCEEEREAIVVDRETWEYPIVFRYGITKKVVDEKKANKSRNR